MFQPSDRYNYANLLQLSTLNDLTDVRDLITFSRQQAKADGIDFGDFIEECTFDRSDCSNDSRWISFFSEQFGRCFTFTNAPGWCL
jgi:hypothetical protein